MALLSPWLTRKTLKVIKKVTNSCIIRECRDSQVTSQSQQPSISNPAESNTSSTTKKPEGFSQQAMPSKYRKHTVRSVFKLFDALILPVVAYGCKTWLHETSFVKPKAVTKNNDGKAFLQKLATDPLEKLHLRFLKWTLQVHKKAQILQVMLW